MTGNIGGLVANTPYFVTTIDGGGQLITLSTSPTGANVTLTADTGTVPIIADAMTLTGSAAANTSGSGGNLFTSYVYANDEAGFIVRQKGKQKYLVEGAVTGLIGQCLTANLANTALTPNTMNIVSTNAAAGNVYVQSLNDYNSWLFTANSSPIATDDIVSPGQPTGNLGYIDADPVIASFNTAAAANANPGQPYPIVTINSA